MSEENNNLNQGDENLEEDKSKEDQPQKVNIKQYKDLQGVSLGKLNFGLWYVEHKQLMRKILIGLLIFIASISWSYTIYGFAYYIIKGMAEDELMSKAIVETGGINHEAVLLASAKDLTYNSAGAIKSVDKKYDFYAKVTNPNENHLGRFEYYFLVDEVTTNKSTGFILPGESKYFLDLSNELNSRPVNIRFVIDSFQWSRINKHNIPNWNKYRDDHINIIINETNFVPARLSKLSEKINLNQLEFNTTNASAYNYWKVDFAIILFSGSNIVGVNKYSLDEFMSGEERDVEMSFLGKIGAVNKIEISPEIDLLKDDIYIKYEGGIGEEK